jgi:hypothetical protein
MVFQPGQSGNPKGYNGGRQWRHREIFDEIKKLGHRDALLTLSTIQHETQDESLKIAAAAALAPYAHPKLQSIPTPRFIENPIDVPDFQTVEIAESFLAKVTVLTARGELDFQSALELSTMAKAWIETQYAKHGLDLKAMDSHEHCIKTSFVLNFTQSIGNRLKWYLNLVNQVIPTDIKTRDDELEANKSLMKLRDVNTSTL